MIPTIIFSIAMVIYLPLAGSLLYVWWKYSKGEIKVSIARIIFLFGSLFLFWLMIII